MERIKIRILFFIFVFLIFQQIATADLSEISPVVSQRVSFEQCNKVFNINSEKLYYLSLASANANRFDIVEMQSKQGYIRFVAAHNQFLATVMKVDNTHSILKITPCSNNYFFPVGIATNFFKYIELNINTPIENL